MSWIVIDENQQLVYESNTSRYAHALWPSPVVTPAKITYDLEGKLSGESSGASPSQSLKFREDYYDPTARIRRGRFYSGDVGSQPQEWHVQPHPARPLELAKSDKLGIRKRVYVYQSIPFFSHYMKNQKEQPLVLLGIDDRFTIWTVIDVEGIAHGEDLVTLKARSTRSVIPEIDQDKVPENYKTLVNESISSFVNEVYRAAPVSVIDRARDTASQILLAYFELKGSQSKDLGQLVKKLEQEKMTVAASAAHIIARLHARAKPSERHKRDMPPIREQNAQLAIECVGVLLSEIRWVK